MDSGADALVGVALAPCVIGYAEIATRLSTRKRAMMAAWFVVML
jgi:thiaminase